MKKIGIVFAALLALIGIGSASTWIAAVLAIFWLAASYHHWKIFFTRPYYVKTALKLVVSLLLLWAFSSEYHISRILPHLFVLLVWWWIAGWIKVKFQRETTQVLNAATPENKASLQKKIQRNTWIRRLIATLVLIAVWIACIANEFVFIAFLLTLYWYVGLRKEKILTAYALLTGKETTGNQVRQGLKNILWEGLLLTAFYLVIYEGSDYLFSFSGSRTYFDYSSYRYSLESLRWLNLAFFWLFIVARAEKNEKGWFSHDYLLAPQEALPVAPGLSPSGIVSGMQPVVSSQTGEKKAISEKPIPSAKPKSSFDLGSFLAKNIVGLLLLLGVGFIFVGMVAFLRSHWEQYKYLVFSLFLLLTLSLFALGYRMLQRSQGENKIGFTFLILACLFFPLNFYFAVKVGLIADHGNRYIVFWLTSALFVWNAWLLRSTFFTLFACIITAWANLLTLQKFFPEHQEIFAFFLALHALAFSLVAYLAQKKSLAVPSLILQYSAQILYLGAAFSCIFWWKTEIFAWVMAFGTILNVLQLRLFAHAPLALSASLFTPFTFLLLVTACNHLVLRNQGISMFWEGFAPLVFSFFLLRSNERLHHFLPSLDKTYFKAIPLATVPTTLLLYLALGAYTSETQTLALFLLPMLAMIGYVWLLPLYPRPTYTWLAIVMSGVALVSVCQQTPRISWATWSIFFLFWGLTMSVLANLPFLKTKPWIHRPLWLASHAVVPIVLILVGIWGKDFYIEHLSVLTVVLILALCFYGISAFYLARKDMLGASLVLLLVLCAVHAHHLHTELQHFCFLMALLANVLLWVAHTWSDSLPILKALRWFAMTILFGFTLLSLTTSLGYDLPIAQLVMLMGALFFYLEFIFQHRKESLAILLVYATAAYFLFFHKKVDFYSWGNLFLIAATLLLLVARYLDLRKHSFGSVLARYSLILSAIGLTQLVLYTRFYYFQNPRMGLLFSALFFATALTFFNYKRSLVALYAAILFGYAHLWFALPRNLFAFEYALYFMPVAIALLVVSQRFGSYEIGQRSASNVAQMTVLFFIALPAVIPGVTPNALISLCVIALAFVFYFLCVYFYRKTFYCYLSGILFLCSLWAALFAAKRFSGNEMALGLALGNLLLMLVGAWVHKKSETRFALPLWLISILCTLSLVVSCLIQGKIDNPTLATLAVCSVASALLSLAPLPKNWLSPKTFAYLAVAIFGIFYYLMLSKLSLDRDYLEFYSLFLTFISLGLSLLLRKTHFAQAFLWVAVLAPTIALYQTQGNISLSILMLITSIGYGLITRFFPEFGMHFLSVACFIVALFSLGNYFHWSQQAFMLLAVVIAQLLFYATAFYDRLALPSLWAKATEKVAYLTQFVFFALFLGIPQENIYYPVALGLASSILLLLPGLRIKKYLSLAGITFILSYYVTLSSWAVNVWEFYTVPLGVFFLFTGYFFERKRQEEHWHHDFYLVGFLFLCVPSLIQSYYGWFAHLAPIGISPYQHLYHSLFLSLESLAFLLYGVYQKRLLFFFSGIAFLASDLFLLLFSYVHFGIMPQAVWWASLGALLITSAWFIEYRKETLRRIRMYFAEKYRQSMVELKNWE